VRSTDVGMASGRGAEVEVEWSTELIRTGTQPCALQWRRAAGLLVPNSGRRLYCLAVAGAGPGRLNSCSWWLGAVRWCLPDSDGARSPRLPYAAVHACALCSCGRLGVDLGCVKCVGWPLGRRGVLRAADLSSGLNG
jgi:hypothetical protein